MAFQSQIPRFTPGGDTIAQLLMRQGDIRANAAMQSAAIWGRTIENIGNLGAQAVDAYSQQKREKQEAAAVEQAFAQWDGKDPLSLYRGLATKIGPERATKLVAGYGSLMKMGEAQEPTIEEFKVRVGALAAAPPEFVRKYWSQIAPRLAPAAKKFLMFDLPQEPDEQVIQYLPALDAKLNGKEQEGPKVIPAGAALVDETGKPLYSQPKAVEPPTAGSFEAFVASRYPQGATPEQMLQARGEWGRADDRPRDPLAAELAQLRLDEARQRAQEAAASAEALKGMGAEWEGLVGRATSSMSGPKSAGWRKTLAQTALTGDKEELADQIRQAALESENVAQKDQIVGRRATIASLEDTRSILRELKAKGVPTNWLAGNVEDLARKLGTSTNTEYVALGNRLMGTLINYRRAATGVQFSEKEQAQYSKMFPNYTNTLPVNLALIDGLMREMKTYDRVYWEGKLGKKGARLVGVVKDEEPSAEATGTPPRPPNVPANYRWDPSVRRWRP